MKVGKRVVLAVSLAVSLSAFADGFLGSGTRSPALGSGAGITSQDGGGLIGSGTRAEEEEDGRGVIGSGTRADNGMIGSGTITSNDGGGTIGSGTRAEEEEDGRGVSGSGTRTDSSGGWLGNGNAAIVTDAAGARYLVITVDRSVYIYPFE